MAAETDGIRNVAVPADGGLPQLAMALDVEQMSALLPAGRQWRVVYLRYKPGTSCIVLYEAPGPEWVYAKVFASDASQRLAGRGCRYLPQQRMAIVPMSSDLAIRGLRQASSEELLRRAVPEPRQPEFRRQWGQWEPVRYKPERRCVLRGRYEGGRFYARFYASQEQFEAVSLQRNYLAGLGAPVPARIGRSRSYRTLLDEELPGEPLRRCLGDPPAVQATARALAAWHNLPPPLGARSLDPVELLKAAEAIDHLLGDGAASGMVRELTRTPLAPAENVLLHGDFYYDQVLVEGDTARLLDLDRLALGDPHQDLANFCAHIHAARHGPDEALRRLSDSAAAICGRFLEAYERAANTPVSLSRLEWHFRASLVRIAALPFRRFDPAWPERVRAVLAAAWRPPY